jgi:hypothetical protein
MYEGCMDFNDYVREYGLARSEGVLLRHLSQAYKTAVQNVPETSWTEEFEDILAFLHGLVRRTDSSLIEEWELLVSGPLQKEEIAEGTPEEEPERDITADPRAFKARVRNELHVFMKALADRNYEGACGLLLHNQDDPWTAQRLEEEMAPYYEDHTAIDVSPRARGGRNTMLTEEGHKRYSARQRIIDPEGEDDWTIYCLVDASVPLDLAGPLIQLDRIGT